MNTIAVLNYGMGNVHSVSKALEHVNAQCKVVLTNDHKTILQADRVVFPGVGAIKDCIDSVKSFGLDEVIIEIAEQKPLLCICVGMQAMFDHSEENNGVDCLGIFPGNVVYFGENLKDENNSPLKIPQIGWNQVNTNAHPLWKNINQNSWFYFVHSYYANATNKEQVYGYAKYGVEFPVAIGKNNVFAVQFHPEKSQQAGLQLLQNFTEWGGIV